MTIRIAFKRICYGLAGLSVGIVLYILTGYPQKWKDVKMGMNEERVHQICGPPANPASWDVKGAFYYQTNCFGQWGFLAASSESEEVGHTRVFIDIGPNREFRWLIKYDDSYLKAFEIQWLW